MSRKLLAVMMSPTPFTRLIRIPMRKLTTSAESRIGSSRKKKTAVSVRLSRWHTTSLRANHPARYSQGSGLWGQQQSAIPLKVAFFTMPKGHGHSGLLVNVRFHRFIKINDLPRNLRKCARAICESTYETVEAAD